MSVVIPTYGRASRVLEAISSALEQQPPPDEILVIDDASPHDDAPSIPDHPLVRAVVRAANGGVAAASNTGLREASGDYICFLHSDDVYLPGKLAQQLEILDQQSEEVVANESSSIRTRPDGSRTVPPRFLGADADDIFGRRVSNPHITPFMFRRRALLAIGGFDERLRAYEDYDLLLRLRRTGSFTFLQEPTCVLDQDHPDRLGESPWMAAGRGVLLTKYADELAALPRLPRGWQEWEVEAALRALESGDARQARAHLARSSRGDRWAQVRRAPLSVATYGPPVVGRIAARAFVAGSRARRRR